MFLTIQQITADFFKQGDCYNTAFEYEEHSLIFLGVNFENEYPVFDTVFNFIDYCYDRDKQQAVYHNLSLYFHYCDIYGEPINTDTHFNIVCSFDTDRNCYLIPRIDWFKQFEPKISYHQVNMELV